METKSINVTIEQEILLRSIIRNAIIRYHNLLEDNRFDFCDVNYIRGNITDLKALYLQLSGHPFRF